MGVPSCCLCWLHNSGVSTPSVFSQSKNTLGLTLNHLDISFPRPNLKAIFSLFLSPYRIYTQTHTSPHPITKFPARTTHCNNPTTRSFSPTRKAFHHASSLTAKIP